LSFYNVSDADDNLAAESERRRQKDEHDSDVSDVEHEKSSSAKIEKFRELIRSLHDNETGQKEDEEFEMEVTWEPGINCFLNL